MRQKITKADLIEMNILQQEALRAIDNENYKMAFELAGAIDQIFYRRGIDAVVVAERNMTMGELYRKHNGTRRNGWSNKPFEYVWEINSGMSQNDR